MAKVMKKADYIKEIELTKQALEDAKSNYAKYVKENPDDVVKQASLNEIRLMQQRAEKLKPKSQVDKEAEEFNSKISIENSTAAAIRQATK